MTEPRTVSVPAPVLIAGFFFVLLGLLIVALTWFDDDEPTSAAPPPSTVAQRVPPVLAPDDLLDFEVGADSLGAPLDDFERAEAEQLGTSSSGIAWTMANGVWGTDGAQARTTTAGTGDRDAFALVDVGGTEGVVAARFGDRASPGSGITFWYEDPLNHWVLQPAPRVSTWILRRMVNGTQVERQDVGLASTATGTVAGVVLRADGVDIWVDGARRLQIEHRPGRRAVGAGLVGLGAEPSGRWDDLWVLPAS